MGIAVGNPGGRPEGSGMAVGRLRGAPASGVPASASTVGAGAGAGFGRGVGAGDAGTVVGVGAGEGGRIVGVGACAGSLGTGLTAVGAVAAGTKGSGSSFESDCIAKTTTTAVAAKAPAAIARRPSDIPDRRRFREGAGGDGGKA